MPCDPYTEAGYFKTIGKMVECVNENVAELVLMGIQPTYPSEKYGYVAPDAAFKIDNKSHFAHYQSPHAFSISTKQSW